MAAKQSNRCRRCRTGILVTYHDGEVKCLMCGAPHDREGNLLVRSTSTAIGRHYRTSGWRN